MTGCGAAYVARGGHGLLRWRDGLDGLEEGDGPDAVTTV